MKNSRIYVSLIIVLIQNKKDLEISSSMRSIITGLINSELKMSVVKFFGTEKVHRININITEICSNVIFY